MTSLYYACRTHKKPLENPRNSTIDQELILGTLFTAKSVVASAVLLFAATAANAAITTYTSQASYLSAVGTTGVDTFDDLDIAPYDGPLTRTAGDYGYTVSAAPNSRQIWGASVTTRISGSPAATASTSSRSHRTRRWRAWAASSSARTCWATPRRPIT